MDNEIRVVIADDHLVVREGLKLILETDPNFRLVGEAVNGVTAVQLAGELQPDVVILDLRMPGIDGIEVIKRIHDEWPNIGIVILTTYNEEDLMVRGIRAGALGYLLKDTDRETLFGTLHAAARGDMLLQSNVRTRVLSDIESSQHTTTIDLNLSLREKEVLELVAQGFHNKEIASQLNITERTVKAYLSSIYNKLGVDSRAAAVMIASKEGILSY